MSTVPSLLAKLDFSWLFGPVEHVDDWLTGILEGAPLLLALGIAFVLGLRHASDPDHLVAVTSLIASDQDEGTREATRLGAWWGVGHATTLVLLGVPMIAFHSSVPVWLETLAERGIGILILILALRVILKWVRGDYRATSHEHPPRSTDVAGGHRHLRDAAELPVHRHRRVRTPHQAFCIGLLHGLAGTGAVVVLLLAALPSSLEAALALAVFAPMSIFSMAAFTTAFAWLLTRPIVEPLYHAIVIPALGAFGVLFGPGTPASSERSSPAG